MVMSLPDLSRTPRPRSFRIFSPRAPRETESSSCATISWPKFGSSIFDQSICWKTMKRPGYGFTMVSSTCCSLSPHIPVRITTVFTFVLSMISTTRLGGMGSSMPCASFTWLCTSIT